MGSSWAKDQWLFDESCGNCIKWIQMLLPFEDLRKIRKNLKVNILYFPHGNLGL
jgi:hemolysin-activating ACP:hemolysin acyltransferase